MVTVRPSKLFQLLPYHPWVTIPLPQRAGRAGSLRLLETFLLIAGARLVYARNLFEFGTFFGANTLNLATNVPGSTVYTLDLPYKEIPRHPNDRELKNWVQGRVGMDFEGIGGPFHIVQLIGDSLHFDFTDYASRMDFVFVDGGHDLETLERDSAMAFAMMRDMRKGAIFWHDYGNPDYPDLTAFLNGKPWLTVHFGDTMLAALFFDESIYQKLIS